MLAVIGDGGGRPPLRVAEGWGDHGHSIDLRGLKGEGVDGLGVVLDAAVGGGDEDLLAAARRLGKPIGENV